MTNISEQKMNSDAANSKAAAAAAAAAKPEVDTAALGKDIRAKWDKFSEIEVSAIKSEDDLVTQLVSKYSFDKPKAETEAKALINGRQF